MRGRLVRLARPTDEDYGLLESWMSSSAPVAPLTGDLGSDPTAADLKQANQGNQRFYMVRLLADDTPVGTVNYQREGPGWCSLGGAIGDPELWQKGYAADAFMVLIDYLFHTGNARKVTATAFTFNKRSMQMLSRAGFVCEGILREHCYLDGQWHDAVLWSMLRAEFYEQARKDAERSERLAVQDLVPAADKAQARRVLAEHLRSARTSIGDFLDRS